MLSVALRLEYVYNVFSPFKVKLLKPVLYLFLLNLNEDDKSQTVLSQLFSIIANCQTISKAKNKLNFFF